MTDTADGTKRAVGRPSDFSADKLAMAKGMYLMGATDHLVAVQLGVTEQTIYNWSAEHPEFFEIRKIGKETYDANVERSLYERAKGYSHPDVDIRVVDKEVVVTEIVKHYPPDPVSMIFWLKNRKRAEWRDRIDHNVSGNLSNMSDEEIDRRAAELLAKGRAKTNDDD